LAQDFGSELFSQSIWSHLLSISLKMMLSSLSAVIVFAAAVSGKTPQAFDPVFKFPKLKHVATQVPTETEFSKACFSFIYETLGGKQGPPKLPADKISDKLMAACHQKDREGCKNFGDQLRSIVEKKEKEPAKMHQKHNHLKNGKRPTKVKKVEVEKPKPTIAEAPKPAPVAAKKDENDYGMKVWKPKKKDDKKNSADSKLALAASHAKALEKITEEVMEPIEEAKERQKKMSLLAPIPIKHQPANFRASDYGLTDAEGRQAKAIMGLLGEQKDGIALIQTSVIAEVLAPKNYNAWCSNLYAAATATWTPEK